MSGNLDLSGGTTVIRIRKGADQTLNFACQRKDGTPADLTGQTPSVRVMDGASTHALAATIVDSSIVAELPHSITGTLSPFSKFAVSITDGADRVTPLVYGQLVTVQDPLA